MWAIPEPHLIAALVYALSPAQHIPTGKCVEEIHLTSELASIPQPSVPEFPEFDSGDAHGFQV